MKAILAVLLIAALATPSFALYFQVTEGIQRCFLIEVPEQTLVLSKYTSLDHDKTTGGGDASTVIKIVVKDPTAREIATHDAIAEGRFAFTSQMGGEHQICLKTTTNNWLGNARTFRFQLEQESGGDAQDYGEIAKQEHLSAIEIEVRKLNDKIRAIRGEQDYQRQREEQFRDTSESTNARVMWWSIAETVILVLSGLWQISSLKNFFKDKKYV
jgi:hypothetical protein